MYKQFQRAAACAAVAGLLAGCEAGASGPNGIPKISTVDPLSTGKLQFAVGTANLYGMLTGLNVVSTYRQSNGLSNVLVNTPTITGPFTLPASNPAGGLSFDSYSTLYGGPSVEEVAAGGEITGTSQNVHPGTPACDSTTACSDPSATGGNVSVAPNTSTFGQAGGVFTNGIAPGNSTTAGTAASYVPYSEPMYDTTTGNAFTPFGGPPAFPGDKYGLGLRDGLFNIGSGVVGVPLGITTFANVGVSTGTYTLSVQVPTGNNGSTETYGTVSASGTLSSPTTLGTITAPTITLDGNGGGTIATGPFPAGVTEELIEIEDIGDGDTSGANNCQGATGSNVVPVYYTLEATSPGTLTLPDTIGPNTNVSGGTGAITPSETICSAAANTTAASTAPGGDMYTVQAIGADYPLYESLYPNSTSQTPTIANAAGQADITISALAGTATASARARAAKMRSHTVPHTARPTTSRTTARQTLR
jgi:hypothetical protein